MQVLIVGATGNLGSRIVRHLLNGPHSLRVLVHTTSLPRDLMNHPNIEVVAGDLDDPASLLRVTKGVNCIIYVAGVLFRPRPEKFLHRTNTLYVRHIVDAALSSGVERFILISFPHIEENTTPECPATGRLDVQPKSIHARTRLAAEKYLFHACEGKPMHPLVLRAGVIYGTGIKLIEAARFLLRHNLLAVWQAPTWIHLLALPDFLRCVEITVERTGLAGIYNLCDDAPITLQEFVDTLAAHWGYRKPPRLPALFMSVAAAVCESTAAVLHTRTPITRDILQMAMCSVVADTTRMKTEIHPDLLYPTLRTGLSIL